MVSSNEGRCGDGGRSKKEKVVYAGTSLCHREPAQSSQ
jgi:hypothetical protein